MTVNTGVTEKREAVWMDQILCILLHRLHHSLLRVCMRTYTHADTLVYPPCTLNTLTHKQNKGVCVDSLVGNIYFVCVFSVNIGLIQAVC